MRRRRAGPHQGTATQQMPVRRRVPQGCHIVVVNVAMHNELIIQSFLDRQLRRRIRACLLLLRSVGFLDVLSSTPAESPIERRASGCAASRRTLANNAGSGLLFWVPV